MISSFAGTMSASEPPEAIVVADSVTRRPLAGASVFDSEGRFVGVCDAHGRLPRYGSDAGCLTVRCVGYGQRDVPAGGCDTLLLPEYVTELQEVVVESRGHKVLHVLAYVREYSLLTNFSDSVYLFREKMADFMLTPDPRARIRVWNTPRVLKSRSYYHYTDVSGLDSVNNRCNHHFSWADWACLPPVSAVPRDVAARETADTVMGRYSPSEIWRSHDGRLSLDVNALADTAARRWMPSIASFMRRDVDFENVRAHYNYINVDDSVSPLDLDSYSMTIESNGRDRDMFMFNRPDRQFYVSTHVEVYIIDREYITVKEARKWARCKIDLDDLAILEPDGVPPLQPAVRELIDRVNMMDYDGARLALTHDERLAGRHVVRLSIGHEVLKRLKGMLGIDGIVARRKWNHQWNDFRRERREHNHGADSRK